MTAVNTKWKHYRTDPSCGMAISPFLGIMFLRFVINLYSPPMTKMPTVLPGEVSPTCTYPILSRIITWRLASFRPPDRQKIHEVSYKGLKHKLGNNFNLRVHPSNSIRVYFSTKAGGRQVLSLFSLRMPNMTMSSLQFKGFCQ